MHPELAAMIDDRKAQVTSWRSRLARLDPGGDAAADLRGRITALNTEITRLGGTPDPHRHTEMT